MFVRILIALLMLTAVAMGQKANTDRITEGDPIDKVYKQLGTPTIEFPLKGKFIQQYEQCTVTSSNRVVLSVIYKETARVTTTPDEKEVDPTIQDIMVKAEQGDAQSQYILAYCLQVGQSITQDDDKAVQWYIKAAMQGHVAAQHNLGCLYMTGEGIEQDYEQAYAWALLAASNGNDSLRKALQLKMTNEQVVAGKLKAEQFRSKLQTIRVESEHPDPPTSKHASGICSKDGSNG